MQTQGISNQTFSTLVGCQAQPEANTLQSSLNYNASNQISSGTWLDASKNTHTGSPQYDAAGEMTSDLLNNYLYNPEGQVCAVQTGPNSFTGYLYDAEGHRVAKGTLTSLTCDPTNLQITAAYFIGPDGQTMTEIDGNGSWVRTEVSAAGQYLATYTPTGLHLPVTDWLGTKRLTVNPSFTLNNGVEETCASFPFGDQLNCSTPIDASPKHFTGKERDTESGLDYFGARYYGSSMGRFMSPDWSDENDPIPYANLRNPQSLNLYSYVHNNPLRQADPDGHDGEDDEDQECCTVAPAPVQTPTASDWMLIEEAGASILGDVGGMFAGAIAVPFALTTTMNEGPNDDCHLCVHGAKKNDDQEHTKNARPSTKGKHQAGRGRKKKDKGGEKGDVRRRQNGMYGRKPPRGHKGPWPPPSGGNNFGMIPIFTDDKDNSTVTTTQQDHLPPPPPPQPQPQP